ncbi:hypothetical protein AVEN_248393-1, partial [Araneus ventricosus]
HMVIEFLLQFNKCIAMLGQPFTESSSSHLEHSKAPWSMKEDKSETFRSALKAFSVTE